MGICHLLFTAFLAFPSSTRVQVHVRELPGGHRRARRPGGAGHDQRGKTREKDVIDIPAQVQLLYTDSSLGAQVEFLIKRLEILQVM